MIKAIVRVRDNRVVNIIQIEEDANYQLTDGHILVDYVPEAIIGGTYLDGVFTPPIVDIQRDRREELKIKFRKQTGTFEDIQEFLADHI